MMRQHAAKKQSVFHTELHSLWSIKVLKSTYLVSQGHGAHLS